VKGEDLSVEVGDDVGKEGGGGGRWGGRDGSEQEMSRDGLHGRRWQVRHIYTYTYIHI
jgi:hypothetical protein